MKVYKSSEVPRCTEINRKATKEIEFTSKVDPNLFMIILVPPESNLVPKT